MAVDGDRPIVRFHNAVHNRQSQTRAFAGRLSCEEWLKNPSQGRLIHSATGVTDGHARIKAGPQPRLRGGLRHVDWTPLQLYFKTPGPSLHRMAGIGPEVHKDLMDLGRVREHRGRICR